MKRVSVDSSMIRSVGYDEASRTLEIEFNAGGVYQYYEVPYETYQQLIAAPSKGKYFLNQIKGGYFFARISAKSA